VKQSGIVDQRESACSANAHGIIRHFSEFLVRPALDKDLHDLS